MSSPWLTLAGIGVIYVYSETDSFTISNKYSRHLFQRVISFDFVMFPQLRPHLFPEVQPLCLQ